MPETAQTLIQLAAARFKVQPETLRPESDLFDALAINSFQALELMSEVEQRFDVEIPDWELQDLRTFAELAALIEEYQP